MSELQKENQALREIIRYLLQTITTAYDHLDEFAHVKGHDLVKYHLGGSNSDPDLDNYYGAYSKPAKPSEKWLKFLQEQPEEKKEEKN